MSEQAIQAKPTNGVAPLDTEALIMKAVEAQVPVESLERLLSMREALKAEQAKEQYFQALSGFQADCPTIQKTREVKDKHGRHRYSYASLDDIVKQVSPVLQKYGLSFTTQTEHKDGFVVATCQVHHVAGHSTESTFAAPIDKEAFMNEAQKAGSAQSFAKRYAFCNALGILTSDHDDDGQALGQAMDAKELEKKLYTRFVQHTQALWNNLDSVIAIKEALGADDYYQAAQLLDELDNDTQIALNLAPTKGGIFTTEERSKLKSDELGKIRREMKQEQ